VDAFRAALGPLNAGLPPGAMPDGRREITWDDAANPYDVAPYFTTGGAYMDEGIYMSQPRTRVQISAPAGGDTPPEFGHINPAYPSYFAPFSGTQLFSPLDQNAAEFSLAIPLDCPPAPCIYTGVSRGIGAVFSDVDRPFTTYLQARDAFGRPLGAFFVPATPGDETYSFLGIVALQPVISRAYFSLGNRPLVEGALETGDVDLVVLDDFIFGDLRAVPPAIPEPASLVLVGLGIVALAGRHAAKRPT
jgi:hypothetical protein